MNIQHSTFNIQRPRLQALVSIECSMLNVECWTFLLFQPLASLKTVAISEMKDDVANAGRYARAAAFKFVQLLIGLVVAASLFLSATWGSENEPGTARDNLYATMVRELSLRFQTFFRSFAKVIGAQIIVSTINTGLTAIFLTWNHFPFASVIIVLT